MRTVKELREDFNNYLKEDERHNTSSFIDLLTATNIDEAVAFRKSLKDAEEDAYLEQRYNSGDSSYSIKTYIIGDNPSEEAIKALFDD